MTLPIIAHGLHWVWHRPHHFYRKQKVREEERNVVGKIVIITGANHGIGKETALELARRGCHIVMACRNMPKAEIARQHLLAQVPQANIELLKLDLEDLASVRAFAAEVHKRYDYIDMLINNAGVYKWDPELSKTKDGFESHIGINHLGPFLLTLLLLDLLNKHEGSRIISVTSSVFPFAKLEVDNLNMKNVTDLGPHNIVPYANSKLANILFIRELVNRLGSCRISAYAVCPGIVYTDEIDNEPWYRRLALHVACRWAIFDAQEGCQSILYCVLSETLGHQTGNMYRLLDLYPVDQMVSDDQAYKLWQVSETLVNEKFVKPPNLYH